MAILEYYCYWKVRGADGSTHEGGSRSAPTEISCDGYVDHDTVLLATATSLTVWNSGEAITTFDFFYLRADQNLKVEITCDRGGEVGLEEFVFVLPAGRPLVLPDDTALALYSGTLSGGTSDVIDEIVVRNESGSDAIIERAIVT